MIDRMTRAARLNVDLYEEVEHNPGLNDEARNVVILVSALGALGVLLSGLLQGNFGNAIIGGIVTAILGVVQWYLWSFLTLIIGTKVFGGSADFGEISRTIAYAYTPFGLRVFAFVPGLGGLFTFVGNIWALVCGVVAIRQAMDFDTAKGIATILIAGIVSIIVVSIAAAIVLLPLGIAGMLI